MRAMDVVLILDNKNSSCSHVTNIETLKRFHANTRYSPNAIDINLSRLFTTMAINEIQKFRLIE